MSFILPLEVSFSTTPLEDFGVVLLLAVPLLLFIGIILAIARKKQAAKKAFIAMGICLLVGAGLCGWFV